MSRWGKPRKNVKRIDPRYFMDEKMEVIEEGFFGDMAAKAKGAIGGAAAKAKGALGMGKKKEAPQLDEEKLIASMKQLYKAVDYMVRETKRRTPEKIGQELEMWTKRDPKRGPVIWWQDSAMMGKIYGPARAIVEMGVMPALQKGWKPSNDSNAFYVLANDAAQLATKFLKIPSPKRGDPESKQRLAQIQSIGTGKSIFDQFYKQASEWNIDTLTV